MDCQALIAMSSGGITGTGLGSGTPHHIPLGHSTSFLLVLSLNGDNIGGIAVIILLATLIYRIFRSTALLPRHSFSALLNTGIVLLFLIQTIVNIGGVLHILPLTGVPLIFISYGGSAMLLTYLSMGYVFSTTKQ